MIVCVLRSGGEYKPCHVRALKAQVPDLCALSDVPIDGVDCLPLESGWPGWWSKMEMFGPRIKGDILYLDLDTIVRGDIDQLRRIGKDTVLSDFYFPERMASGVMYLTEETRAKVWEEWMQCPDRHMQDCSQGGDQRFLSGFMGHASRWQDELPGMVASYKVHVCRRGSSKRAVGNGSWPEGCNVLCFHGNPRPWNVREFSHLYNV